VDRTPNRGLAYTCNEGADAALGDWIVFLNVDTLPQAGWLESLLALPSRQADAAIVGARLLFPQDDTVQHVGGCFDDDGMPHHVYLRQRGDLPFVRRDRQVQWVTGACLAIERTTFGALGGFDVAYGTYSEDADLCFAVRQRLGGRIWVAGGSVVHHFEGVSAVPDGRKLRTLDRLRAKWGAVIRRDEYEQYADDGFSRAWLDLTDAALVPRDFALLAGIRDALGLGAIDAQERYARDRSPEALLADVRRLRRQGRVRSSMRRASSPSALFRLLQGHTQPTPRRKALDYALAKALHQQHVDLYSYNLASVLAERGERDLARGLLQALFQTFGRANPALAGKAAYKMALLAESPVESREWLRRAVALCPGHRSATAALLALDSAATATARMAS
jgi:hypothetical protein